MTLSNFRVPLLRRPVLPWLHQHLEIPRWIFILRHSPGICSYKVATIFTKFSHFVNNGPQLKLCSCVHVDFCMLLHFKTLLLQDVCPHRQTPCGAWQGPSLQQVKITFLYSVLCQNFWPNFLTLKPQTSIGEHHFWSILKQTLIISPQIRCERYQPDPAQHCPPHKGGKFINWNTKKVNKFKSSPK